MADEGANREFPVGTVVPTPKRSSGAALLAGMILLSGIGVGAWWVLLRPGAVNSSNPSQSQAIKVVLPLESFTVNLADTEEGRFLRVTISLGVDGELPSLTKGESRGAESSEVSMATIRDSILTVLAQSKSGDLLTPEGKLKLKADLLEALNRDVPALQAREVYFTEFLVQR